MRLPALAVSLVLVAAAAAAATYPPSYEWRTITTEHFEIHYHQGEEELAARAVAIAEQIHVPVTSFFGWTPANRTQLVLTDNVDVSNGSATPFPYNRIEIYVSAPGGDPSSALAFYDDWLTMVITHEYAHIVHLDQARGFPAVMRRIFGRTPIAFPNQLAPLWMIEGIATLVESEFSEAGRLKGTFLDMVLRAAADEGRFATEPQAGGLTPDWPGGNRRYLYGAAFLEWLARTRGLDRLGEYFQNYSGNFVPYRVNASARDVYDASLRSLWNEWSELAQAGYRRQADAIRADGVTSAERMTSLGYETLHPAISPDGQRLAYTHRGPFEWPTLRIRDLGAAADVATLRINSSSPLSWSPDGRSVAFSQLEFDGPFRMISDLYVWEIGGGVRRVTSGARLKAPAHTPDGATLLAVQNEAGRNRIVAVDLATAAVTPLVTPAGFTQFSEIAPSPDGSHFAVAEWESGRVDVVLYRRDGTRVRSVTASLPKSVNASPRFSPDGATIVFSSDVTGVPNIFEEEDGGTLRRVSNTVGGAFYPVPMPDGSIVFSNYSSRGFDLMRTRPGRQWPVTTRVARTSIEAANVLQPVAAAAEPGTPRRYAPWRTLAPTWWTPIIGATSSGDANETSLGVFSTGSDALGFHSWSAQLLVKTSDREHVDAKLDYVLSYAYDRLYPTITAAAYAYSDDAIAFRSGNEVAVYRERIHRELVQAAFPFRRFRWQTTGVVGAFRETVGPDGDLAFGDGVLEQLGLFDGTLNGIRAAALFNNARAFGYSISPENGVTALADYQRLRGERELEQLRGDVRGFLTVPYRRSSLGRHVAALRVAGGATSGDFLLERELKLGGAGSEGFVTADATRFPVRGFESGILRGRSALLASLEYRFPLYDIERGPSTWPLFVQRIFGDVFYDTATAWYPEAIDLAAIRRPESNAFDDANTIASAGAEISLDLFLGYYIPLRYRLGAAYVVDAPPCAARSCARRGDVEVYLAVGRSF